MESAAQRHVADNGDIRGVVGTSDASRPADPGIDGTVARDTGVTPALSGSTAPSDRGPSTTNGPADQARRARELLRTETPEIGRSVTVRAPSGGRRYQVDRYPNALGQPVTVARINVNVASGPGSDPRRWRTCPKRLQQATDTTFNQGSQFPNGEWFMVDLVPVDNPADAELRVRVDDTGRAGTTHPNADVTDLMSQLRNQLGLAPSCHRIPLAERSSTAQQRDRPCHARPAFPPALARARG